MTLAPLWTKDRSSRSRDDVLAAHGATVQGGVTGSVLQALSARVGAHNCLDCVGSAGGPLIDAFFCSRLPNLLSPFAQVRPADAT